MVIKRLCMTWPACTIYLWSIADFQKWSKSIRFSRGPKWVSCIKIPSFTPYQLSLSKKMNTQRFRWIYIFHSLHRYFLLINFIRATIFSISFWVFLPLCVIFFSGCERQTIGEVICFLDRNFWWLDVFRWLVNESALDSNLFSN